MLSIIVVSSQNRINATQANQNQNRNGNEKPARLAPGNITPLPEDCFSRAEKRARVLHFIITPSI